MDENKLKVLKEINYQIRRTCGNCRYSNGFSNGFSTCKIYRYNHLKHSKETRELSINENGYCSEHEWYHDTDWKLQKFVEFKEK